MRDHLSQDQFARCFVGDGTMLELRHIAECPSCSAELEGFATALSAFRRAVRDRVDGQVSVRPPVRAASTRPPVGTVTWQLALAATVALILAIVPVLALRPLEETGAKVLQEDPNVLMSEIQLHLSRRVPAPMEALMNLVPEDDTKIRFGGVR